ncbi:MAG: hypothetical protein V4561_02235 [Bacteroidota bacterium]
MESDKDLPNLLNWNVEEQHSLEHNIKFSESINYNLIKTIFTSYLSRSPLSRHSIEGRILRVRFNEGNLDFHKVSQLSYNSECPERIKFGRFNREGQPMFYGSIPKGSKESHPGITACLESFPELTIGDGIEGQKDFTVGIWKTKPIELIDLTFDLYKRNPFKDKILQLVALIKSSAAPDISKAVFEFWEYISQLCANKSTNPLVYFLSNVLLDTIKDIIHRDSSNLKGIIYPSSRTERKGTNIVLYPQAVDEHLRLDSVLVYRLFRRPNEKTYDFFPICEPVKVTGQEFKINRWSEDKIEFEYQKLLNSV